MLINSGKTARRVSQASLKPTECHAGCGAQVWYRTNPRVACDECALDLKRERARLTAEKRRRSTGIQVVKGTKIICADCSFEFVRRCSSAYRCPDCQRASALRSAREASETRSRERGAPKIGSDDICAHCRNIFARTASRERYCADCKLLQSQGRLPHLVAFRAFYAKQWREARRNDPEWCSREKARLKALRERRKLEPSFAINERMSAAIRGSLKGGKDGASWETLVGYALTDLVRHLERQFLPGMSWDNHALWHVDHIVPLASFTFTSADDPEFRAAWTLTNLRPLWKADNLAKSDQRLFLI